MSDFLERYLARIGLSAPPAGSDLPRSDLASLRAIVAAHTRTIPFENLAPWTGRDVSLDPDALAAKLVDGGRGGYCFEQNAVLQRALDALGFVTTSRIARVTFGRSPGDPLPARSHMLLEVALDEGPHLVDVGFGGQTLTGALHLDVEDPQPTPHEPYRLTSDEHGRRVLAALVADSWRELYRIEPDAAEPADYEQANFFTAHSPGSGFVTHLVAARVAPDRRYAFGGAAGAGAALSVHHLGGPSEKRDLPDAAAVREALEDDLHIDTAAVPDLDAHLPRLFAAQAGPTPDTV